MLFIYTYYYLFTHLLFIYLLVCLFARSDVANT